LQSYRIGHRVQKGTDIEFMASTVEHRSHYLKVGAKHGIARADPLDLVEQEYPARF
jgi:hypothetical protein